MQWSMHVSSLHSMHGENTWREENQDPNPKAEKRGAENTTALYKLQGTPSPLTVKSAGECASGPSTQLIPGCKFQSHSQSVESCGRRKLSSARTRVIVFRTSGGLCIQT